MVNRDELEIEVAILFKLPLGSNHDVWGDAVFLELGFDECERQR